jgi:plasmid stabilization system protein ParE
MPIPRQIEWSALALKQFDQIITYLEERNPNAARRLGQAIFSKVEFIGEFPKAHRQILGLPSYYRETSKIIVCSIRLLVVIKYDCFPSVIHVNVLFQPKKL